MGQKPQQKRRKRKQPGASGPAAGKARKRRSTKAAEDPQRPAEAPATPPAAETPQPLDLDYQPSHEVTPRTMGALAECLRGVAPIVGAEGLTDRALALITALQSRLRDLTMSCFGDELDDGAATWDEEAAAVLRGTGECLDRCQAGPEDAGQRRWILRELNDLADAAGELAKPTPEPEPEGDDLRDLLDCLNDAPGQPQNTAPPDLQEAGPVPHQGPRSGRIPRSVYQGRETWEIYNARKIRNAEAARTGNAGPSIADGGLRMDGTHHDRPKVNGSGHRSPAPQPGRKRTYDDEKLTLAQRRHDDLVTQGKQSGQAWAIVAEEQGFPTADAVRKQCKIHLQSKC